MFWKIVGILFALLFAYGGVYCLKNPADGNGPLGIGLFGIAILFAPKGSNPAAGFVLSGVFILIAVVWHLSYREHEKDGINAKRRAEEASQIEAERQRAIASQESSSPWEVRYAVEPCPYCGHYKVRSAKWEDKQLSVAFWGVASSAIGKEYKCEHCKKMW